MSPEVPQRAKGPNVLPAPRAQIPYGTFAELIYDLPETSRKMEKWQPKIEQTTTKFVRPA